MILKFKALMHDALKLFVASVPVIQWGVFRAGFDLVVGQKR